jgi:PRTRC genetic system protein B
MSIFFKRALPQRQVRAVQALIVHESVDHRHNKEWILTTHGIEHTDTGAVLGAGRLLAPQDEEGLLDVLANAVASRDRGFIPPEVIACSASQLVWYVPSRIAPMWFRIGPEPVRCRVPWPPLLFRVSRGQLAVVALRANRRPDADTVLYHAPLMNVHANTALCSGSARLPTTWRLSDRPAYEAAVYATNFSHVNHEHTLRLGSGKEVDSAAHLKFWQTLARKNATAFPTRALVALGETVAEFLFNQ